jgi:hypothetical protein
LERPPPVGVRIQRHRTRRVHSGGGEVLAPEPVLLAVLSANKKLCGCCRKITFTLPVAWVYECRATHAAGVSSGRRWIGRSANPGRTAAK